MKKVKVLMLGLASMFLLQACVKDVETQDQEKAKENRQQIQQHLDAKGIAAQWTDEGIAYVIKPGSTRGRKPENAGDQLIVQYVGSLLNETVFDRSESNKPLRFGYNDGTIIPGFNDGIGLMQKGDTADLYLPSDLAFGNRAYDKIPAYSPVWFHVVLEDVLTEDEALIKYKEEKDLKNANNTPVTPIPLATTSGSTYNLYHIITKEAAGTPAEIGKRVTVTYRGLFLSGTEFDKGSSVAFTLQEGALIKGFLEGVLRMKTGEKATILIPSGLGYQASGSGKVPPYAPLVFEVELLKVE